jgi:hypothetical protein
MKPMRHEEAVSPVVGIMLMLVVTIIIAAVVSGFAGGIAGSSDKGPQATIQAEYSQSAGMKIYHMGGDTLKTKAIGITIRPAGDYGAGMEEWATNVNKMLIEDRDGMFWFDQPTGKIQVAGFAPGDVAYISAENCKTEHLMPEIWEYAEASAYGPLGSGDPYDYDWGIVNPEFIGGSFYLEIFSLDGKLVASTKVPISA